MRSQNPVCVLIRQNLDETIGVIVRLCSRVCHERKFADFVLNAFALEIFFCFADPADFRVRVDDRWHAIVINVDWATLDALHADNALVFGLVGQHGAVDAVADGVNIRDDSLEVGVDRDAPTLVTLDTHFFEAKVEGVGPAADAY